MTRASTKDKPHEAPESIPGTERPTTPCIEWRGCRDKDGYGLRKFRRKRWRAHRAAYVESVGELEPGVIVRHQCDNRACTNPEHLVAGSLSENAIDKSLRSPRGSNLKLSPEQVLEIWRQLQAGRSQRVIARDFGVSRRTVRSIKTGYTWAHLTGIPKAT